MLRIGDEDCKCSEGYRNKEKKFCIVTVHVDLLLKAYLDNPAAIPFVFTSWLHLQSNLYSMVMLHELLLS